jgi:hypothetical protein
MGGIRNDVRDLTRETLDLPLIEELALCLSTVPDAFSPDYEARWPDPERDSRLVAVVED